MTSTPATSPCQPKLEQAAFRTVGVLGMQLAHTTTGELLDHIFGQLANGQGGWLITANIDFVRRFHREQASRRLYRQADISVADGMPLVWASKVAGDPLPERIAGSSLLLELAQRAAEEGRRLFLLGGAPGAAARAAQKLTEAHPGLQVGHADPFVHFPPTRSEIEGIGEVLKGARPDLLMVGLGSPKQEALIAELRALFPQTWMAGVGVSFSLAAGSQKRAPRWMQAAGLEWTYRLAQEPGRLARRYLLEDLPFAGVLFGHALAERWRRYSASQKSP